MTGRGLAAERTTLVCGGPVSIDVLLALLGSTDLVVREVRRLQEWLAAHTLTAIISAITCLARDHGARCIVVDPISALGKSDDDAVGLHMTERLIDWAKHRGITMLCTSLLSSIGPADAESTPMHISTIADNWLHLSYWFTRVSATGH